MPFTKPAGWQDIQTGLWKHRTGFLLRGISTIDEADLFDSIAVLTTNGRLYVYLGQDYRALRVQNQSLQMLAQKAVTKRIAWIGHQSQGYPAQLTGDRLTGYGEDHLRVSDPPPVQVGLSFPTGVRDIKRGSMLHVDYLGTDVAAYVFAVPHAVQSGCGLFTDSTNAPTVATTWQKPSDNVNRAYSSIVGDQMTVIARVPLEASRASFLNALAQNIEYYDEEAEVREKVDAAVARVIDLVGGPTKRLWIGIPYTFGLIGNAIIASQKSFWRTMPGTRETRVLDPWGTVAPAADGTFVTCPGPVSPRNLGTNGAPVDGCVASDELLTTLSVYRANADGAAMLGNAGGTTVGTGGPVVHLPALVSLGATVGDYHLERILGPIAHGMCWDGGNQPLLTTAAKTLPEVITDYANLFGGRGAAEIVPTYVESGVTMYYTPEQQLANLSAQDAFIRASSLSTYEIQTYDGNTISPGMLSNLFGMALDANLDPLKLGVAAYGLENVNSLGLID